MKPFRSHLHRNVLGYLALFIVLGGSAYAAVELRKNQVKSRHIASGQVKTSDLGGNSVTSGKVRNGSLRDDDFAPGQFPTGPTGAQGPTGASGPTGAQGATGAAGPTAAFTLAGAQPTPPDLMSLTRLSVTLPVAGKLFVSMDSKSVNAQCVGGQGEDLGTYGLYVDDTPPDPDQVVEGDEVPISGTSQLFNSNVPLEYHVTGVTNTLSAGTHIIALGANCQDDASPSGAVGVNVQAASLSAILLGS